MAEERENAIEFLTGQKQATVTFTQRRYINRIEKLLEQYPEEIEMEKNKDGSICAHVPVLWVKIIPPRKSNKTEEEKMQTMRKVRGFRKN